MIKRRRAAFVDPANFESFVDVVCNLIGGLLLVAGVSVVAVQDPVFEVFSPVEDSRMEEAVSVKFAVTEKGIYPLDENAAFSRFHDEERRKPEAERLTVETDFCVWVLHKKISKLVCKLKDRSPSITEKNLHGVSDAALTAKPIAADSRRYFAYFFVSPDDTSFRLFRLARRVLWKEKIKVGWGPVDPQKGIVFAGISAGVRLRPQE